MDPKKKVLIVDDDHNLTTVLVDKLNASGFQASSASDGEEGLKASLDLHPDLILLDVMMPKVDGLEMLEMLRTDEWGKTAKVIMLTSVDSGDKVIAAIQRGSNIYLTKTDINLDGVVKKVHEVLG